MAYLVYELTNCLCLYRLYCIKLTGVLFNYYGQIIWTINQLSTIVFLQSQGYRRWIRTFRMIRKLPFSFYKYVRWPYFKILPSINVQQCCLRVHSYSITKWSYMFLIIYIYLRQNWTNEKGRINVNKSVGGRWTQFFVWSAYFNQLGHSQVISGCKISSLEHELLHRLILKPIENLPLPRAWNHSRSMFYRN